MSIHHNFIKVIIITLFFLLPTQIFAADWTQDAGNAQRTGSTEENPLEPWTFLWSWNGPDTNGGIGNHIYDSPKEARTVTGGNNIYVPAGSNGLYALAKTNGSQSWRITTTSFNAAPVYDSGFVYAGGTNGTLYKINASNGQVAGNYASGSPINKAVLVVGSSVYAVSDDGKLHKVNISTMSSVWTYSAGSTIATPPSYSSTRDIIIYATDDLYVHAVNNSNGTRKWRVKPSPNLPGHETATSVPQTYGGVATGNQFELGWPVVADKAGTVFIRMQLVLQAHFEGPNGGKFANTNAENRSWLEANPQYQNLFALNLDDGSKKFTPAVGYGSTEDWINDPAAYGVMGSQPAISDISNNKQVAYIQFRNLQGNTSDFRWSGHMGEMVLDNSTISGLEAGDLRFINFPKGQTSIIDEQNPISIAGNTIFHAHWSASNSIQITNRTDNLGLTYTSPIQTSAHPPILRALSPCGTKNATSHFANCNTQYYTDGGAAGTGRFYGVPGWWGYWGVADPPGWRIGSGNTSGTSYSAGFLPRYTYVADGKIVVEGNGGELLIFSHSGTVSSPTPTVPPSATPTPTVILSPTPTPLNRPCSLLGDTNFCDGVVNALDFTYLSSKFGTNDPKADLKQDGIINVLDYSILSANFGKT